MSGPEMGRLVERLYGNPEHRCRNFRVWWEPEANNLDSEERAAIINRMLDDLEQGGATEIIDVDDYLASADGRPKDGDDLSAPLATSAVGVAETPSPNPSHTSPEG